MNQKGKKGTSRNSFLSNNRLPDNRGKVNIIILVNQLSKSKGSKERVPKKTMNNVTPNVKLTLNPVKEQKESHKDLVNFMHKEILVTMDSKKSTRNVKNLDETSNVRKSKNTTVTQTVRFKNAVPQQGKAIPKQEASPRSNIMNTSIPNQQMRASTSMENSNVYHFSPQNIYDINYLIRQQSEHQIGDSQHYTKLVDLLDKFKHLLKNALPKIDSYDDFDNQNFLQLNMLFYKIENLYDESLQVRQMTRRNTMTIINMKEVRDEELKLNLENIKLNSDKRIVKYNKCLKLCMENMIEIRDMIVNNKPVKDFSLSDEDSFSSEEQDDCSFTKTQNNIFNNMGNVNFNVNLNINKIQNITSNNHFPRKKSKKEVKNNTNPINNHFLKRTVTLKDVLKEAPKGMDKRDYLFNRVKTMRKINSIPSSSENEEEDGRSSDSDNNTFENIKTVRMPPSRIKQVNKHTERSAILKHNIITEVNLLSEDEDSLWDVTDSEDEGNRATIYNWEESNRSRTKKILRARKRSKTSFSKKVSLKKLNLNNSYSNDVEMHPSQNSKRSPSVTYCQVNQCQIY